jgi:DNA primase
MQDTIKLLRSKDLVDFFSAHVSTSLSKIGKNYSCPCPLHGEKEASFYIDPIKNKWTCYGACGKNGDILDFVMSYKAFSFPQALEYLCGIYNIKFKKTPSANISIQLKEINNFVADFYTKTEKVDSFGAKYLIDRKVSSNIIQEFGIGYCPSVSSCGWDYLYRTLMQNNFSIELAEKIGIIKKSEKSGNYYDAFHERIIFPIKNLQNDVIGFNTRTILKDKKIPRYLLTNETEIFNRKQIYYGYDKTKRAIEKKNICILVEGIFDFLRLYEQGIKNCIPLLGGHYNEIKNVNTYYLMMDFDKAGIKYSSEIGSRLIKENKIVRICKNKKDPDDLAREEMISAIKLAEDFIDWYITKIFRYKDSIECKLQCLNEVSKLLEKLPRENLVLYGDRIAKRLSLPKGVVESHLYGTNHNYRDIFLAFKETN